ncbi:MAG: Fic family protein [Candidatus Nanoarchaeia archaeon]|nr:Fic family protein [Candidatus Nanoarchaeia archaeon]MDD5740458.1 Fic family protein [Candidatus Nanoarchaeia archaeon]
MIKQKQGKKLEEKIAWEIVEFLRNSNYIEEEYSEEALEDSKKSWIYAVKHKDAITVDYILNIHKILMQRINPKIAGKLRDCAANIGALKTIFPAGNDQLYGAIYIEYDRIPKHSETELIKKLDNWITSYKKVAGYDDIKKQHIVFEKLHPFTDGNGRVGRILMNIQCINAGLPIITIHEGRERFEYSKWFN